MFLEGQKSWICLILHLKESILWAFQPWKSKKITVQKKRPSSLFVCFSSFFKSLFFNYSWHTILHKLQTFNIVVRRLGTLQSNRPVSSARLAPCMVIIVILTAFPMRSFRSLWLLITGSLYLMSFTFFTYPFPSPPNLVTTNQRSYFWDRTVGKLTPTCLCKHRWALSFSLCPRLMTTAVAQCRSESRRLRTMQNKAPLSSVVFSR